MEYMEQDQVWLHSIGRRRKIPSGEFPVLAGQRNAYLYFIVSGLVRGIYVTEHGVERTKCFSSENEWFGTESFLYGREATYSIECLEEVECICIRYEDARKSIEEVPKIAAYVNTQLLKAYQEQEERSKSLLTMDAKSRYDLFQEEYGHLASRIKQKYIASYLGIDPVSLSRIRNSN